MCQGDIECACQGYVECVKSRYLVSMVAITVSYCNIIITHCYSTDTGTSALLIHDDQFATYTSLP